MTETAQAAHRGQPTFFRVSECKTSHLEQGVAKTPEEHMYVLSKAN